MPFLVFAEFERITPKKVAGTEESSLVCSSTSCRYAFSPAFFSQFDEMTRIISLFQSLEGQHSSNYCISFFQACFSKLSPQISLALCQKMAISWRSEVKSGPFLTQLMVLLVYLLLFLRNLYWLRFGIAAQYFLPSSPASYASSVNTSVKLLPYLTLDTFVDLCQTFLTFRSACVRLYSLSNLYFFQSGELRSEIFLENIHPLISWTILSNLPATKSVFSSFSKPSSLLFSLTLLALEVR